MGTYKRPEKENGISPVWKIKMDMDEYKKLQDKIQNQIISNYISNASYWFKIPKNFNDNVYSSASLRNEIPYKIKPAYEYSVIFDSTPFVECRHKPNKLISILSLIAGIILFVLIWNS